MEVMLAITILLLSMAGSAMYIVSSRRNLAMARVQRIAQEAAESALDVIKANGLKSTMNSTDSVNCGGYTFKRTQLAQKLSSTRTSNGKTLKYDVYEVTVTVEHPQILPITLKTIMIALQ